ncbi:hypothetical protein IKE83_01020 [Candidatus Saccharibacteria bacterium]|nr:hypothetical protein [Candidatus Saccharibacteria bacterium]
MKKDKIIYLPLGILTGITAVSGVVLSSAHVSADVGVCTTDAETGVVTCNGAYNSTSGKMEAGKSVNAKVTVAAAACTIAGTELDDGNGNDQHTFEMHNGESKEVTEATRLNMQCNDSNGFVVYAVGHSGSEMEEGVAVGTYGNNNMVGVTSGTQIPTGLGTGETSQWSMKITPDTVNSFDTTNLTIPATYQSYALIPATYQEVAKYSANTDTSAANPKGVSIYTNYKFWISSSQAADTYVGRVKYTLMHPQSALAPEETNNNSGNGS